MTKVLNTAKTRHSDLVALRIGDVKDEEGGQLSLHFRPVSRESFGHRKNHALDVC